MFYTLFYNTVGQFEVKLIGVSYANLDQSREELLIQYTRATLVQNPEPASVNLLIRN